MRRRLINYEQRLGQGACRQTRRRLINYEQRLGQGACRQTARYSISNKKHPTDTMVLERRMRSLFT